jgi:hypothetical protein
MPNRIRLLGGPKARRNSKQDIVGPPFIRFVCEHCSDGLLRTEASCGTSGGNCDHCRITRPRTRSRIEDVAIHKAGGDVECLRYRKAEFQVFYSLILESILKDEFPLRVLEIRKGYSDGICVLEVHQLTAADCIRWFERYRRIDDDTVRTSFSYGEK